MTELEKELEKALAGKSADDEVAPLADTADSLRTAFAADVPEARSEQLLFTHGAGLRKRSGLGFRLLIPAVALGSFLFALVLFGRTAPPGGSLYPVRGALQAVGLAEGPIEEVEDELTEARHDIAVGERLLRKGDPEDATDSALDAIDALDDARELLPDLDREQRAVYRARIDSLELKARDLIRSASVAEEREDRREDSLDDDDNSGSGGGDDDSGSGSDDSDDDNSGSGSDDSDDDNSGSGSSGSGSDDDNSGSGSSGSGSDDDNSGSGSDD